MFFIDSVGKYCMFDNESNLEVLIHNGIIKVRDLQQQKVVLQQKFFSYNV